MSCITLSLIKNPFAGKAITIQLPASKSESNRLLILNALFPNEVKFENLSTANDTQRLASLLKNKGGYYDTGPAGTVFRFLTAYLTLLPGKKILTGSTRMKERPIKALVDVLISLGADINYKEKNGFPPIEINESLPKSRNVIVDNSRSSQFVSALMLIAPAIKGGLQIELKNENTSFSYIRLTAAILNYFGIKTEIKNTIIRVASVKPEAKTYTIESDWSSASYWYSFTALSQDAVIFLPGLKQDSFQGDAVLPELFDHFGVKSRFSENGLHINKMPHFKVDEKYFEYDFSGCPDIAPTVAVVASALGFQAKLKGLHTLNLKESNRIEVLAKELSKFNVKCKTQKDSLTINAADFSSDKTRINTYEDHRIAMAFAPLVILTKQLQIENPKVVKKSYPAFWEEMAAVSIKKEIN